jgi:hypothetical protein
MAAMTSSVVTRRLLLVTDRRAASPTMPAAGVRRYRLTRLHGGPRASAMAPARKTA